MSSPLKKAGYDDLLPATKSVSLDWLKAKSLSRVLPKFQ